MVLQGGENIDCYESHDEGYIDMCVSTGVKYIKEQLNMYINLLDIKSINNRNTMFTESLPIPLMILMDLDGLEHNRIPMNEYGDDNHKLLFPFISPVLEMYK